MDKMTIELARKMYADRQGTSVNAVPYDWKIAGGFIEGYESRDAEVEELKKKIDALLYWQERGESK